MSDPVIEIANNRSITAAPSAAWAVLADFDHLADWAAGVTHSSPMTATPPGIGATRRVQAGAVTLVETITRWEPERVLAYELGGLPPFIGSASNRWVLTETASGTDVSLTVAIEPRPKLASKALARVVARRISAANKALLASLAARAERGD